MIINKKYSSWILGSLILLLLPFLYLFLFTHPIADDLAFGHQVKTTRFISQLQTTYLNWNGRYSGNFFIQLFPITIEKILTYRLILLVCFCLFVFSFHAFIKSIFIKTSSKTIWAISLFGVLAYLSILPSLAEGFYWYTSVIYYLLSLIFVLLLSTLVINYVKQEYFIHKTFHLCLTIFILVITIGINESVALIIPFVFASLFMNSLIKKDENSTFLTILTIIAISCSAIVVFAPGNSNRLAAYSDNKEIINSLFLTFLQMVRFFAKFIFSLPALFYFLFIACFFPLKSAIINQLKSHTLFIGFTVILFLSIFPSYYATGILGQHRTLNIAALFYILFLTIFALKVGHELKERLPRKPQKMVLYFILFFFILGNGRTVFLDISMGKVDQYNKQLKKRYLFIAKNKSGKINKLTVMPKSIFVIDVAKDSANWVNQAYLLDRD